MSQLKEVLRRVLTGEPSGGPAMEMFDDVAKAAAKKRACAARCAELEATIQDLEIKLYHDKVRASLEDDAELDRAAAAALEGKAFAAAPPIETQLRQAREDLAFANRVRFRASAALEQVVAKRSREVCAALRSTRRARLRELARLLAEAREVTGEDLALLDALRIAGVQVDCDFQPLHFAPAAPFGAPFSHAAPLEQWLEALRRNGVLGKSEDPLRIAPRVRSDGDDGLEVLGRGLFTRAGGKRNELA